MTMRLLQGQCAVNSLRAPSFQREWRELYAACPWSTAFQSIDFVSAWYESYRNHYALILIYESAANQITGLLPLAREHNSERIVVAGAHQAEYQGWLALPENNAAFMTGALKLVSQELGAERLRFKYLPVGTPAGWVHERASWISKLVPHPRAIIPLDTDAKVARYLTEKMRRRSTRNYWNRLKRLGDFRFERIREAAELDRIFDQLILYYDVRQGATHGKFAFEQDQQKRSFHLALMRENVLHVTLLRAGNDILSAQFGLISGKTYSGLMPMFSPFCAELSPMTVHLLMLVEELHREGYQTLDLTPSIDPFKERFAAEFDSVKSLSVHFNRTSWLKSKLGQQLESAARRTLESLRIDPVAAQVHVQQLTRVPAKELVSAVTRDLPRFVLGRRSCSDTVVYWIERGKAREAGMPGEISRNVLEDLLAFEPVEYWQTRRAFLSQALRRIERKHHFYTRTEDGRLLCCAWLAETGSPDFMLPKPEECGIAFPASGPLLYDFYTHSAAWRRELYEAAVRQMIQDAAGASAADYIFASVPAENLLLRDTLKALGFQCTVGAPSYRGVAVGRKPDNGIPAEPKLQLAALRRVAAGIFKG
jgi:CelD/BcsL family acetyltransferase involved in cellulose biosynthesis